MKFTKAAMQDRFEEVSAEIEAIEKKSIPMREKRDAMVQAARAAEDKANGEIRTAETGLYDLKMELGMLAKALGGRSMSEAAE